MNRRGFLGFLGAAIAGAMLDHERLLWEPGRRLISIPAAIPGSSYLTIEHITWEMIYVMHKNMIATGQRLPAEREIGITVGSPIRIPPHIYAAHLQAP